MTLLGFSQAVAITLLFVMGPIFDPVKKRGPAFWQKLASCALCFGFWVGAVAHASDYVRLPAFMLGISAVFGWGALVGAAAIAVFRVLDLLDSARDWLDQRSRKRE